MSSGEGGGPTRRKGAKTAVKKPYSVFVRHDSNSAMHRAIKQKNFHAVQRLLDNGDNFCRREGLNCYELAGDDTLNSSVASNGLHGALSKMHLAIARHDIELVRRLLDNGDTFCTADGSNCFILAASNPRADLSEDHRWMTLEKMLCINSRGILARDEDGSTLLSVKYFYKEFDILKMIIDQGVDLNAVDNARYTLCESLFYPHFTGKCNDDKAHFLALWKFMMSHKEFQRQAIGLRFFKFLVELLALSDLSQIMFLSIIELNIISVDLNFVSNFGKDLLEKLFFLDQSHQNSPQDNLLKLWNASIKYKDFQNQVKEFRPHVLFWRLGKSRLARKMLADIQKFNIWSVDELTIKLKMHPLFYILDENCQDSSSYLSIIKLLLAEHRKEDYSSILKDKAIFISKDISDMDDDDEDDFEGSFNHVQYVWQGVKSDLNIPDTVTFDVIGFFLYSLDLTTYFKNCKDQDEPALSYYLRLLLENGYVPVGTPGVVHPIHALLYNIFKHVDEHASRDYYQNLGFDNSFVLKLLQGTINLLKDFPSAHKQVLAGPNPMLDVHLLMSSLFTISTINYRNDKEIGNYLLNCVKAFMPLSPAHPLQHFSSFYYLGCRKVRYTINPDYCNVALYSKLMQYSLEASGRHKFQAVDQRTIESVRSFFKSFKKFQDVNKGRKVYSSLPDAPDIVEREVSSLNWMCILQIRKTLFLRRSSTSITLPSLIRTLIAEGRLPKGLEADLLLYK